MFLADNEAGKIMSDSFVIVRLDVQEQGEKKALENEGGEDLMRKWHGSGLPFMVILDPKGKVLADTNLVTGKETNIGYPAKPEEIEHFMKMMGQAPHMSEAQKAQIKAWLVEHAPKSH